MAKAQSPAQCGSRLKLETLANRSPLQSIEFIGGSAPGYPRSVGVERNFSGKGRNKREFLERKRRFSGRVFSTCRRSAKTEAAYRIDLAQLEKRIGADKALAAVESSGLEAWATAMRSYGYTGVSIGRKFATARVFFAYWLRKGIIEQSPLWRIRLDPARELVLPRSLSPIDAKRLIEAGWRDVDTPCNVAATPTDRGFLRLRDLAGLEILFATGMRVGELVSLRVQDWQEEESSLLVRGKGSRQRLAFLPDERSLKAVQAYLWHRTKANLSHDALLVNAAGKGISTQGIAKKITKTAATAGISARVTPHMIRHTVATLLLRNGADMRVVQEVLGHASITTTQRYTHVFKDHLLATLRACHPNHHLKIDLEEPPSGTAPETKEQAITRKPPRRSARVGEMEQGAT